MRVSLTAFVLILGVSGAAWAWEYRAGIEDVLSVVPEGIAVDRSADVLIATHNLNPNDTDGQSLRVLKLSGASGTPLWTAGPEGIGVDGWGGKPSGVAVDRRGDVIVAGREGSPIVSNGLVLKLDGRTGRARWRFISPGGDPEYRGWTELAGVDRRGDVYIAAWAAETFIAKLSGRTGEVIWKVQGLDTLDTVAFGGTAVVRGTYGGHLDALDARTGGPRWHALVPGRVLQVEADRRGDVLVSSWPGGAQCQLTCLHGTTGAPAWARQAACSPVVLTRSADVVSVSPTNASGVSLLSRRDGTTKWTTDLKGWSEIGSLATTPHGDVVAIGNSQSGDFAVARLQRRDGRVLWQAQVDGPLAPHAVAIDRKGDVVTSSFLHPFVNEALLRINKFDGRTGQDFAPASHETGRPATPRRRSRP